MSADLEQVAGIDKRPGELSDEERELYEHLISEHPELESAELAQRVLDYHAGES